MAAECILYSMHNGFTYLINHCKSLGACRIIQSLTEILPEQNHLRGCGIKVGLPPLRLYLCMGVHLFLISAGVSTINAALSTRWLCLYTPYCSLNRNSGMLRKMPTSLGWIDFSMRRNALISPFRRSSVFFFLFVLFHLMAEKRLFLISSRRMAPLQTYLCRHLGSDLHPTSTDSLKVSVSCRAARGFSGDPDQLRFSMFAQPSCLSV